MALGGAVSAFGLAIIGYEAGMEMSTTFTDKFMMLIGFVPAAFALIATVILAIGYKITDQDAAEQTSRFDPDRLHLFHLTEGIFERLHEIISFEEALEVMVEEKECVLEFFDAMVDDKKNIEKVFYYYKTIDFIIYGDYWGTQRAGFFSNKMFMEMIYPSAKRIMDYVKSQGKYIARASI